MNRKQIQLAVCKELLNPSTRCTGVFINEDEFAITTDGITAFVFYKNECVFDISKVKISGHLKPFFSELETDVEIKKTGHLFYSRKTVVSKYTSGNFEVYVDTKVEKPFEGYRFFASEKIGRILVKDDFNRLIGVFLPMKFDENEVLNNA